MPRIAALILAAGSSSRMGTAKQLLRFHDQSLIRKITSAAIAAACSPVRVVIGASGEQVRKELADLPVELLENPDWPKGMGSSIRSGMREFPPDIDAVLILLCDQPMIAADHLRMLIDAFEKSGKPLCACMYPDQSVGPPAIFARSFFDQLRTIPNHGGAKQILIEHANDVAPISIPQAAIDLDTPADVEAFKKTIHE